MPARTYYILNSYSIFDASIACNDIIIRLRFDGNQEVFHAYKRGIIRYFVSFTKATNLIPPGLSRTFKVPLTFKKVSLLYFALHTSKTKLA